MSNKSEKFDGAKNEVLVENNAQTIFDHLNDLEKDSKVYSKRWFWELLQNAKDSVNDNGKVSVSISLQGNTLKFSHTGDPFEKNDILHLIFHGSSKKSKEGKTGRFGTGFMSTHLLSRKVKITGKLTDNTFFQFELNREAETVADQQKNLENSYELFCESNEPVNYSTDIYDTKFEYLLSDTSIAEEGIRQLQKILPFVMAFNSKIENIDISHNGRSIAIVKGKLTETKNGEHSVFQLEVINNSIINNIVYVKTSDSCVAILLERREQGVSLIGLDETYPKLYFDFPLFGTENMGLPVVINSTKFDLKAERDGVYLGEEDKPTILENKRIIKEALTHLSTLISFTVANNVSRLYNLFKLKTSFEYSWLEKQWLRNLYGEQIDKLLESDCLIIGDRWVKLNELAVPFSDEEQLDSFYKLITKLQSCSSPEYGEVSEWVNVAEGYAGVQNKKVVDYPFIINDTKLCSRIEHLGGLEVLGESLLKSEGEESSKAAIDWLNKLFDILSKEQTELFTSQYSILPNQKMAFVKREVNKPFKDEIGDEPMKGVLQEFGWDIKEDLIYQDIKLKEGIFQTFSLEKALATLNNLSDRFSDEDLLQHQKRRALITFLKWLIDKGRFDLIKDVFVVVEKSKESSQAAYLKRRLFLTSSDKLLAPFDIWKNKFSLYREIVLKKFVLIDQYTEHLTNEDFSRLGEGDLIFTSPLVYKRTATKNDLKLLVKKNDDYPKLLNDKEELIQNNFEFSDIAYLTRSEDNILSKTGDSLRSARMLLKFLLSQVITNDKFFDETQKVKIEEEIISLSKCLWVSRLRDTQWLPARGADGEKQNNSERPSVANVSELIKEDPDIHSLIKTKHAVVFLNQLGISLADIIRNSITDEEKKLKWDMTFSQLITNGKVDPELAIEMLEDENLQKEYLERKKKREKIKENQNIGYLFEAIFRKIFESEEYNADGFTIRRTAIGSDFGVAYSKDAIIEDQDILDEDKSETFFNIGETLIELKATGKMVAEMTTKQAEEATKHSKNYVLAVLPLSHYEINEETVKENTRFIVNIAASIDERFREYNLYKHSKEQATQDHDDVKLAIEDGNIRYQVKSAIWEAQDALTFMGFVSWLKTQKSKIVTKIVG